MGAELLKVKVSVFILPFVTWEINTMIDRSRRVRSAHLPNSLSESLVVCWCLQITIQSFLCLLVWIGSDGAWMPFSQSQSIAIRPPRARLSAYSYYSTLSRWFHPVLFSFVVVHVLFLHCHCLLNHLSHFLAHYHFLSLFFRPPFFAFLPLPPL